jgi:hypothetical protein
MDDRDQISVWFSLQFKTKVDLTLGKGETLRITINLDGVPITP